MKSTINKPKPAGLCTPAVWDRDKHTERGISSTHTKPTLYSQPHHSAADLWPACWDAQQFHNNRYIYEIDFFGGTLLVRTPGNGVVYVSLCLSDIFICCCDRINGST